MTQNFFHSTVFKIAALMFSVSFLAVASMFSSVFISDSAQTDAASINVAGSLRMQSYRLVSHVQEQDKSPEHSELFAALISAFEDDLTKGILVSKQALMNANNSEMLQEQLTTQWFEQIKPMLIAAQTSSSVDGAELNIAVQNFVDALNELVSSYQLHAESNIATIRLIQSVALFGTLLLIAFAMMIVNRHIDKPLSRLTDVAKQIGRGDFTARADESGKDELALLARTINKMSESIYRSRSQLESLVKQKTEKLSRSNESLDVLYEISRRLNNRDPNTIDFKSLLERLANVTGNPDLDLCIMTAQGHGPYEHLVTANKELPEKCIRHQCGDCTEHNAIFPKASNQIRYQLTQGEFNYGVLTINPKENQHFDDWQNQLFESVAEQIANGLSRKHRQDESRRVALMNERTVIARELHDSLAQALSYLKIQVTRLQRLQKVDNAQEKIDSVIDELKNGLGAAYSELRELLTTFRLKLDGQGIKAALEQTIEQFKTRSDSFTFVLQYDVEHIPFTPQEEIHLLQIAREATQNAFYHSKGSEIRITITSNNISEITLCVTDNGIGIPGDPNKLNHYGLAIMVERSRNLDGTLNIERAMPNGTQVRFSFLPEYARDEALSAQNG